MTVKGVIEGFQEGAEENAERDAYANEKVVLYDVGVFIKFRYGRMQSDTGICAGAAFIHRSDCR